MATPLLVLFFDPRDILVALVLPVLIMDVALLISNRHGWSSDILRWPLVFGGIAGAVAGAVAISLVNARSLAVGIGIAVTLFALLGGKRTSQTRGDAESKKTPYQDAAAAGVGFIGGFTGFFGPPVVAYLQYLKLPKETLVRTAAATFIALGVTRLAGMASLGLMTGPRLSVAGALVIPGLAGVASGIKFRRHLSERTFASLVRVIIAISGIWLIARNLIFP